MMKYLFFLALVTNCWAERWIVCSVRTADGIASWRSDEPTSDTAQLPSPPAGTTWRAFPLSTWTATAQKADDGVPVLVVNAGCVVNRGAAVVAAERVIAARIAAKTQFLNWRQTLTAARQSLSLVPGDPFFQAQVSQAASMVTSYASAASIPVTTATTQ